MRSASLSKLLSRLLPRNYYKKDLNVFGVFGAGVRLTGVYPRTNASQLTGGRRGQRCEMCFTQYACCAFNWPRYSESNAPAVPALISIYFALGRTCPGAFKIFLLLLLLFIAHLLRKKKKTRCWCVEWRKNDSNNVPQYIQITLRWAALKKSLVIVKKCNGQQLSWAF